MKKIIALFSRMTKNEFLFLSASLININLIAVYLTTLQGVFADFGVIKLTPFSADEALWIFLFLILIAVLASLFMPKGLRNIGTCFIISAIPSGVILFPVALKTAEKLIAAEIVLSVLTIIGLATYELVKAKQNKRTIKKGKILHRTIVVLALILTINSQYACLLNKGYITSDQYKPAVLEDNGGYDEDIDKYFLNV